MMQTVFSQIDLRKYWLHHKGSQKRANHHTQNFQCFHIIFLRFVRQSQREVRVIFIKNTAAHTNWEIGQLPADKL